ncbi:MAG: aminopeptidase P family protein [Lentisphaerae bacterium]|nr:aminopeptidase P family protein [Lentisphaerota bacterium]
MPQTPLYSEFPLAEYQRRVERARAEMAKLRIDALLLTARENLRYFAGGPLTELFIDTYNTFFLLLSADPTIDAALIMSTGREGPSCASWVPDKRFWGYGKTGSVMDQSRSLSLVVDTIAEKGLAKAAIATELDNGLRIGMTATEFQQLREALPKAEFRSAAPVVWPVRAIKSDLEIAKIRQACRITCEAFAVAQRELRAGMMEREAAAIVRSEMFKRGATGEGFLALFGGPRGIWADAIASDYRFQRGDLIMFDGGCCVDGYYADVSRMAWVGEPPAADHRLYELARQANAEALAALKPGAKIKDVHAAGQRAFRTQGAGELLVFGGGQLGHGIGLSIHEQPDMSADSEEKLQPGMVIAVEPAITNKPRWTDSDRFFIVENNVVITEQGYELLTPMPDELWIVEA